MSAVAGAPLAPTRRYSILVTADDREPGTWHTITASSLGDALRGVRSGSLWEAAHGGLPPSPCASAPSSAWGSRVAEAARLTAPLAQLGF